MADGGYLENLGKESEYHTCQNHRSDNYCRTGKNSLNPKRDKCEDNNQR